MQVSPSKECLCGMGCSSKFANGDGKRSLCSVVVNTVPARVHIHVEVW